MLCTQFGLIWPDDFRKEVFTDRQTDDGQWMIRKAHLNHWFKLAKKVMKIYTNTKCIIMQFIANRKKTTRLEKQNIVKNNESLYV